jgi:hypothetical protein
MNRSPSLFVVISLIVGITFQIGFVPPTCAQKKQVTLTDIADHPAESPAIQRVLQQGIMQPVSPGIFKPESNITRGDFAVMMQRMFALSAPKVATRFSDLETNSAYFAAVTAVAPYFNRQVLCVGCLLPTTFQPGREITRAEMAVTMINILISQKKISPLSGNDYRTVVGAAPDAKNWPAAASFYFALAIKQNVLPAAADKTFSPWVPVTRAQGAVLMDGVQKQFSIPQRSLP